MNKLILTLALLSSASAFAATSDFWEGPGSKFDLSGNSQGNYGLVVENTPNGNQIQSTITITLADGTTKIEQCQMTYSASGGWKSDCGQAKGGGNCYGEGMCISYEEDSNGKAFATTIAMDGPSDMRLLRTELQNGKAVAFYREKLHKR